MPGVIPHQGEGNRDDVVIRGQRTNADFFVNGVRDDVQYFRDLYNIQRIEVLKGPNAMIFGRGGGGGVINRVLKEADRLARFARSRVAGGQFGDRRVRRRRRPGRSTTAFGRLNAVYENRGSYRDFVDLERYGVNPTMTFAPNRSDHGQAHLRVLPRPPLSRPRHSLAIRRACAYSEPPYNTAPSTFFGNPNLNYALVDANIATAVIEHDFDNGLKVKNSRATPTTTSSTRTSSRAAP